MIKATIERCRHGFAGLSAVFKEVKLPRDTSWRCSRLIELLEQKQKHYQRVSSKLYMDAGATFTGTDGFSIAPVVKRREKETEEAFLQREDAHRAKMNKLYADLQALDDTEVEINYNPIPLSWFPVQEKDEQGKDVDTKYPTEALAYLGLFVADDVGLDAPAAAGEKKTKEKK